MHVISTVLSNLVSPFEDFVCYSMLTSILGRVDEGLRSMEGIDKSTDPRLHQLRI